MGLLKNLSLKGKLYAGFGFVICLSIVIAGIAIYSMVTSIVNLIERWTVKHRSPSS